MQKTLILNAVLTVIVIFFHDQVLACKCMPKKLQEHVQEASLIFEARVLGSEGLKINKVHKGEILEKTISLLGTQSVCQFEFKQGHVYTVYSQSAQPPLEISICSGTHEGRATAKERKIIQKAAIDKKGH